MRAAVGITAAVKSGWSNLERCQWREKLEGITYVGLNKLKQRTAEHQPWLGGFAFLTFAASLVLLYAGGFTTTIGAGMVFPDWPLSNGSLNPPGWTTDQAMLAEHSHRLMGMVVGTLCIILAVWMYLREARGWLRWLSYGALLLVIFQGVLGGLRVLMVSVDLAKVHGVTGQIFICTLVALAVGTSRWWRKIEIPEAMGARRQWQQLRWMGVGVCLLTMVQLVLGAIMRHRGAGLSIPYFPHSSPDGGLLPLSWNWATQIHFAHRVVALLLFVVFVAWLIQLLQTGFLRASVKKLAVAAFFVIVFQILLGASIIWTARAPIETTLHVLNGAIFLCLGWAITFSFFKPLLEPRNEPCKIP